MDDKKLCELIAKAFSHVDAPSEEIASTNLTATDYLEIGRDVLILTEECFDYFLPRILCALLMREDRETLERVIEALSIMDFDDPDSMVFLRALFTHEFLLECKSKNRESEKEKEARFKNYTANQVASIAEWLNKVGKSKPIYRTDYKIALEYWNRRSKKAARRWGPCIDAECDENGK